MKPSTYPIVIGCSLGLLQANPSDSGFPAEVTRWIDTLSQADCFDTGVSPTYGGSDFPPVGGQAQWSVATLSDSRPHRKNTALAKLVELGPTSLPALLAHLDDKRPSKIVVKHDNSFGGMWHAAEVPAATAAEEEKLKATLPGGDDLGGHTQGISEHTVTVGDLCFVAVGMITNRPYNAVRYQPTACIVVNSPTTTPEIARAVRSLWQSTPPAAALQRHLAADFKSGGNLRSGAAVRWLYYFPDDALPSIKAALKADPGDAHLVAAAAWHSDPALRKMIRAIALAAKDGRVVARAMPAFASSADVDRRTELTTLLHRWKTDSDDPYRSAFQAIARQLLTDHSAQVAETIRISLKIADDEVRRAFVQAALGVPVPPAAVKELAPLLAIKREGVGAYLIEGPGVIQAPTSRDYLQHRLCDNAWVLVSRILGDQTAICTGDRDAMNRRIATLRQRLNQAPDELPFTPEEISVRIAGREARAREVENALAAARQTTGAMRAVLMLENDRLNEERWQEAVGSLFTADGGETRSLSHAVLNRNHDGWTRAIDTLDAEGTKRAIDAILRRIQGKLDTPGFDGLPDDTLAGYLCLVSRKAPGTGAEIRSRVMRILQQAVRERRISRDATEPALLTLEALLQTGTPGADDLLAKLCRDLTPAALDGGFDLEDLLKLVVAHRDGEQVDTTLATLFAAKSPWAPSRQTYSRLNDFTEAGLLEIASYRTALAKALDAQDIVGEVGTRDLAADYCWMEWKDSSSGKGIKQGEPLGFKPGEKMKVRRCDMIAEATANAMFADHDGRPFHIYWPLKMRDAGIVVWKEWLARKR
jgi:hypothetical protein